jgi:hypothetical protein
VLGSITIGDYLETKKEKGKEKRCTFKSLNDPK